MEVLVGAPSENPRKMREDFLRHFSIIELDERVARDAISLRQKGRLKLPDAIIWASARLKSALVVTRNTKKTFPPTSPKFAFHTKYDFYGCVLPSAVSRKHPLFGFLLSWPCIGRDVILLDFNHR